MTWSWVIAVIVVAATGLFVKFGLPRFRKEVNLSVSWPEFGIGLFLACAVVIPSVLAVGGAMSTDSALKYQEFYNGVETSATVHVKDCHPGSSGGSVSSGRSNCHYEYRTGETYTYQEMYFVTVSDGCDKDGNCSSHQEVRYRPETGYIYAPYATKEYVYEITDSLGETYRFPQIFVKDGEGFRGEALPGDIPRGDPAEWANAKKHLDEGDPRPVTRMFKYDNYILASQDEMLKPFSQNVEQYKEAGILPEHTKGIMSEPLHGFSSGYANKVSFVGVKVADESAWQQSLMEFNAALGSKYQGDMHLVLIDTSLVDNQTDYMDALKAYWLGPDFGRRALSKNAIIVVAGVKGDEVAWAKASTGMPFGNEVMLQGITNFTPGTKFAPSSLIGAPRTVVVPAKGDEDDSVTVSLSSQPGVLERVVLDDFSFQRACMKCVDDDGEQIGYGDLISQIEPPMWQLSIMIFIVFVLSAVYWVCASIYDMFEWKWLLWVKKSKSKSRDNDDFDDWSPRYSDRMSRPYGY
ncbi:MAG: hypothetical protein ABIR91_01420 [Candidatus Saccharimonadales bacterium]